MVRLGIGLYGIDPTYNSQYMKDLFPILCLKTYVCQVATVSKQETIGYSRKGILTRDSKIATLAIGYGDGYPRKLGNGKGYVQLKGQLAPIVGNICMDLMMVDVTDIEGVDEGDEAIILGDSPSIYDIAKWLDTIPYEVLTSVGNRVKRIFFDV
jgi:alanine racemase